MRVVGDGGLVRKSKERCCDWSYIMKGGFTLMKAGRELLKKSERQLQEIVRDKRGL